jgi:hypothetical protein
VENFVLSAIAPDTIAAAEAAHEKRKMLSPDALSR